MRVKFPLIALALVGVFASLFATIIFDSEYSTQYSPNTTEYTNPNSSFVGLFTELNKTAQQSKNTSEDIEEKVKGVDDASYLDTGGEILGGIKLVFSLLNLGLIKSLVEFVGSVLGVPTVVATTIVTIIFISIIFAIIGAILRWRT